MDACPTLVLILLSFSNALAAPPCTALAPGSLERAACHARAHEWKEAERAYRAHTQAHPDSIPAALGHVEVLLRMSAERVDYAVEASQELRKLLEAHPEDPAVLKAQATLLGNVEKNSRAAEEVLMKVTRIAPRDADSWALLGSLYLDSHRAAEGMRCFETAASLDPANPLYRAGVARGLAADGRDAEAEKAFAAALGMANANSSPSLFLWYGDFLESSGRYDESARLYARAIAADPADGEPWLKRASAEAKAGRYREAQRDALEARSRGAAERDIETVLVRAYRGLGDDEKALAAAAALERAGNAEEDRRAKWRRARASLDEAERLMQANRFSEALPLYVSVTVDLPEYADAWLAAGVCYVQTGDARRGEQSFRIFVRLQPLSAEGHSALGVLLLAQQRSAEAKPELQEALRLDPSSVEAREALDTLARAK